MRAAICLLVTALLGGWAGGARAQAASAPAGAALAERKAAVVAQFEAETAACSNEFAVTACKERAKRKRSDALQPMLVQERALAAEARHAKAMQREAALAAKRQAAASQALPVAAAKEPVPVAARNAPASAPLSTPAASRPARLGQQGAKPASRLRADMQAHADAQKERLDAIQAHRVAVEKRNAAHAAKRAAALPLPVPETPRP